MNNKQINTWNNLRFGSQHPKHIRKHFTDYFLNPIRDLGFTFSDNKSDHKLILTEQKNNWFIYDKKEDMAFMTIKYIKPIQTFFVVNEEDYDFGVHIGWYTDEQCPTIHIHNQHNNDDIFHMGWSDNTDDSKRIGNAWAEFFDVWVLEDYDHKKRKTKWLTLLQDKIALS